MRRNGFSILKLVALVLLFSGCVSVDDQNGTEIETSVPVVLTSTSPTLQVASNTPTHIPDPITESMPTPTISPTSLKATATEIPQLTWTPLPTVASEAITDTVRAFVNDNGGCSLPCYLGILPGTSSWAQVRQTLAPFALFIDEEHPTLLDVYIPSPVVFSHIPYLELTLEVKAQTIIGVQAYNFEEVSDKYYLLNIFNQMGEPDEIAIYTFRNAIGESRPTGLILYYSVGLMVNYVGYSSIEMVGDDLRICPRGTDNFMYLWDPELEITFQEVVEKSINPEVQGLPNPLPLDSASEMDSTLFFELVTGSGTIPCIETPMSLWPEY